MTNYHDPTAVFDVIRNAGLGCANEPAVFTATQGAPAQVAICGPVASVLHSLLTVAIYENAADARGEFKAHCGGKGWNLYRDGQNWRATVDAEDRDFPADEAEAIARALGTDALQGCSGP